MPRNLVKPPAGVTRAQVFGLVTEAIDELSASCAVPTTRSREMLFACGGRFQNFVKLSIRVKPRTPALEVEMRQSYLGLLKSCLLFLDEFKTACDRYWRYLNHRRLHQRLEEQEHRLYFGKLVLKGRWIVHEVATRVLRLLDEAEETQGEEFHPALVVLRIAIVHNLDRSSEAGKLARRAIERFRADFHHGGVWVAPYYACALSDLAATQRYFGFGEDMQDYREEIRRLGMAAIARWKGRLVPFELTMTIEAELQWPHYLKDTGRDDEALAALEEIVKVYGSERGEEHLVDLIDRCNVLRGPTEQAEIEELFSRVKRAREREDG